VLTDDQRRKAEQLFLAHGYDGELRIARLVGDDERIFVVPTAVLASLPERSLSAELQQALGRKVWIVDEAKGWSETEPLR